LEPRTLLATTPEATATGAPVNLSGLSSVTTNGNANSPAVVIDPYDSQKLFAVWGVDLSSLSPVPHTSAIVEGAYSSNGGTSWTSLGQEVAFPQFDVATVNANPSTDCTQVTDPSVAFDGQGNVYVLTLQTTGAADGELYLTRFNFSGNEAQFNSEYNIYQWVTGSDGVTDPVVAVDTAPSNPPSGVPVDPHANNVYIAWASIDTEPANPDPYAAVGFNPNRAELVVGTPISSPSVPNEQSLAFSGVMTVSVNGNYGPNDNSHPQLVINQNDNGQITVAWDDFGSATVNGGYDVLNSDLVQAGDTYGFSGGTGPIAPATSNTTPGNWGTATVYAAGTSSNAADPVGIAAATNLNNASTDVNGDTFNDIVVADQGTGQIGVLENSGTGTFPTTATYTASGSPSGVVLGDFINGHTSSKILDAATANNATAGGVSVLPNGTPPTDGTGVFKTPVPLPGVPGGQGESADLDGNGIPDIVAADPGNQSIDIWFNAAANPTFSAPISLALPSGDDPIAVVVDRFRGSSSLPDIAVLNSNGTIVIFRNGITTGIPTAADFTSQTLTSTVPNAVSMTSGRVSGNSNLADLIVVTNNGQNELVVLQNSWTSAVYP
jgi:hypothetical protein